MKFNIRARRFAGSGALIALMCGGMLVTQPASATPGDADQPWICHPVGGATGGNQHNGYSIIPPSMASSHINESLYPDGHSWKHEHDGRTDHYATGNGRNGQCGPGAEQPPFEPETETEHRSHATTDCANDTVTTVHQRRTRTEVSDGVWGLWSEWTTHQTERRDATDAECAPPEPPPYADVVCKGSITGGTYANVRVPRGQTCILQDAHVKGDVTTRGARNVYLFDTTVVGDVRLRGVSSDVVFGDRVGCRFDPVVGGSILVTNSHNVLVCQATVGRNVEIVGSTGMVTVRDSAVRHQLIIRDTRRYDGPTGEQAGHRRPGAIRVLRVDAGYIGLHDNARRLIVRDVTPEPVITR